MIPVVRPPATRDSYKFVHAIKAGALSQAWLCAAMKMLAGLHATDVHTVAHASGQAQSCRWCLLLLQSTPECV